MDQTTPMLRHHLYNVRLLIEKALMFLWKAKCKITS